MRFDVRDSGFTSGRHRAVKKPLLAALALVAVGMLLSAISLISSSAPASAGIACKDFYFLSVRGSGQTDNAPKSQTASGETKAVLDGITSAYASVKRKPNYDFYNIQYPAHSVVPMLAALANAAARPKDIVANVTARAAVAWYLNGETRGETQIADTVDQVVSTCPAARVVLAGYSQGAMAVHNYLVSTRHSSNIFGAVLVADPERLPNSAVKNYGNASGGSYGMCSVLASLPRFDRPSCLPNYQKASEVPSNLLSITSQVCNGTDAVCDTSRDVKVTDPWGDFERITAGATDVHMNCKAYCGGTSQLPGNVIGHRLLAGVGSETGGGSGTGTGTSGNGTEPGNGTDAPVLAASSGPAGLYVPFTVAACPAAPNGYHERLDVDVIGPDGLVHGTRGSGHTNDDGTIDPFDPMTQSPSFWTYAAGYLGSSNEDAPIGDYKITVRCVLDATGAPRNGETVKAFSPAAFRVTGPSPQLKLSSATLKGGGALTVSGAKCPGVAPQTAPLSLIFHAGPNGLLSDSFTSTGGPSVSPDGSWTERFNVAADVAPGAYFVESHCDIQTAQSLGQDFNSLTSTFTVQS